jgi:hypothetical protein
VPAAIFLPDRSPRALTAVRESCSACMCNACMSRSSPSHDNHILCARTHLLFGRLRAIANRKSALHAAATWPTLLRRHAVRRSAPRRTRPRYRLVAIWLNISAQHVHDVCAKGGTLDNASLTFTSYFFFLLHASTQAGLVLPPALEHTRTCSTSLRVWQPATTILSFLSSDNIEVKSSPVDRPAIGS